jgi:hypothetical protein
MAAGVARNNDLPPTNNQDGGVDPWYCDRGKRCQIVVQLLEFAEDMAFKLCTTKVSQTRTTSEGPPQHKYWTSVLRTLSTDVFTLKIYDFAGAMDSVDHGKTPFTRGVVRWLSANDHHVCAGMAAYYLAIFIYVAGMQSKDNAINLTPLVNAIEANDIAAVAQTLQQQPKLHDCDVEQLRKLMDETQKQPDWMG